MEGKIPNRPEIIELENNLGPDSVTGEINRVPWMAYDVDETNLYIDYLEKQIAFLKATKDACNKNTGCHYCKDGAPLWESHLESVVIGKHPQTRKPSLKLGHSLSLPIEFCPKCGRKL